MPINYTSAPTAPKGDAMLDFSQLNKGIETAGKAVKGYRDDKAVAAVKKSHRDGTMGSAEAFRQLSAINKDEAEEFAAWLKLATEQKRMLADQMINVNGTIAASLVGEVPTPGKREGVLIKYSEALGGKPGGKDVKDAFDGMWGIKDGNIPELTDSFVGEMLVKSRLQSILVNKGVDARDKAKEGYENKAALTKLRKRYEGNEIGFNEYVRETGTIDPKKAESLITGNKAKTERNAASATNIAGIIGTITEKWKTANTSPEARKAEWTKRDAMLKKAAGGKDDYDRWSRFWGITGSPSESNFTDARAGAVLSSATAEAKRLNGGGEGERGSNSIVTHNYPHLMGENANGSGDARSRMDDVEEYRKNLEALTEWHLANNKLIDKNTAIVFGIGADDADLFVRDFNAELERRRAEIEAGQQTDTDTGQQEMQDSMVPGSQGTPAVTPQSGYPTQLPPSIRAGSGAINRMRRAMEQNELAGQPNPEEPPNTWTVIPAVRDNPFSSGSVPQDSAESSVPPVNGSENAPNIIGSKGIPRNLESNSVVAQQQPNPEEPRNTWTGNPAVSTDPFSSPGQDTQGIDSAMAEIQTKLSGNAQEDMTFLSNAIKTIDESLSSIDNSVAKQKTKVVLNALRKTLELLKNQEAAKAEQNPLPP